MSIPKDSFPFQLTDDACAEILFYRIGTSIENPTSAMTDFAHIPLNRWMSLLMRVDGFVVVNSFPFPVELFWHEESAEPISSGVLQPGIATYSEIISVLIVYYNRRGNFYVYFSWTHILC